MPAADPRPRRYVTDCKSASSVQYLEFAYCDMPDALWFV